MEIGIVGLPNVGKSTLFNALTGTGVSAENFPFTTIDPNVGVVPVNDERLNFLATVSQSRKIVPATIRFVDIAGLVKGASEGEGLGNQFLNHIRSVDAIAHVVRCFHDDQVINVLGKIDPLHSIEIIETELLLSDMQQAQKALDRTTKMSKAGDAKYQQKTEILTRIVDAFNKGIPARRQKIPIEVLKEYQFLTAKPVMYVLNTDEKGISPEFLESIQKKASEEKTNVVVLSAKLEAEILELPEEERDVYYKEAGIDTPGLQSLADAGKEALKLVCFFTTGEKETRAWLVPKGTTAQQAAGKIHSDMARGFIRAEVCKFDDIHRCGTFKASQEEGLVSFEGKEYVVQDGDVIYFRFNV